MNPEQVITAINGVVEGTTAGILGEIDVLPDTDSDTWHRLHVLAGLAIGMALPRDVAARCLDAMEGVGGPAGRQQAVAVAGILTRAVRGDC